MFHQHATGSATSYFLAEALVPHLENVWGKDGKGKKANNDKAINEGHGQKSILKRTDDRERSSAVVRHCHGISFFLLGTYIKMQF
jgi:hypothetical protein